MTTKAKSETNLLAMAMADRLNSLKDKGFKEVYILRAYAEELQLRVEPCNYNDFVVAVNKGTGLTYSVAQLKKVDINAEIVTTPGEMITVARQVVSEGDNQIKDGKVFTGEEMSVLNANRAAVATFDQAISDGKSVEEAEQLAMTNGEKISQDITSLMGVEQSWFQPKYMAAASAVVGAGVSVFAGTRLSIGSAVGGVAAAGGAYFAADYLFKNIQFLKTLNPFLGNVLASAMGMGLGVVGAKAGELVQGRFFTTDEVVVETPDNSIIEAPTAELTAYL